VEEGHSKRQASATTEGSISTHPVELQCLSHGHRTGTGREPVRLPAGDQFRRDSSQSNRVEARGQVTVVRQPTRRPSGAGERSVRKPESARRPVTAGLSSTLMT